MISSPGREEKGGRGPPNQKFVAPSESSWGLAEPAPPNLLNQRPAETLYPLQTLLQVRHAGGVTEAEVVVRAERNAGHGGNLLRFEQLRAEVGALEAGLRDIREQVKRALGIHAGQSR